MCCTFNAQFNSIFQLCKSYLSYIVILPVHKCQYSVIYLLSNVSLNFVCQNCVWESETNRSTITTSTGILSVDYHYLQGNIILDYHYSQGTIIIFLSLLTMEYHLKKSTPMDPHADDSKVLTASIEHSRIRVQFRDHSGQSKLNLTWSRTKC